MPATPVNTDAGAAAASSTDPTPPPATPDAHVHAQDTDAGTESAKLQPTTAPPTPARDTSADAVHETECVEEMGVTAAGGEAARAGGDVAERYMDAVSRDLNSNVDPELEALDASWQSITEKERRAASGFGYHSGSSNHHRRVGTGTGRSPARPGGDRGPRGALPRNFLLSASHSNGDAVEEVPAAAAIPTTHRAHGRGVLEPGALVGVAAPSANEEERAGERTPHRATDLASEGDKSTSSAARKGHVQLVGVPAAVLASTGHRSTGSHSFISTASVQGAGCTIPLRQFTVAAAAAAGVTTTSLAKLGDVEAREEGGRGGCSTSGAPHGSRRETSMSASRSQPHRVMTLEEVQRMRECSARERSERSHAATTGGIPTAATTISTSTGITTLAAQASGTTPKAKSTNAYPLGSRSAAVAGPAASARRDEPDRSAASSTHEESVSASVVNISTGSAGHRVMSEVEVARLLAAKKASVEVSRQVQRQQMKEREHKRVHGAESGTRAPDREKPRGGAVIVEKGAAGKRRLAPAAGGRADPPAKRSLRDSAAASANTTPVPVTAPTVRVQVAGQVGAPTAPAPPREAAATDMTHQLEGFAARNAICVGGRRQGPGPALNVDARGGGAGAGLYHHPLQQPRGQTQPPQAGYYRPSAPTYPIHVGLPGEKGGGYGVGGEPTMAGPVPGSGEHGIGGGGHGPGSVGNVTGQGYPVRAGGGAYPGVGVDALAAGFPPQTIPLGGSTSGGAGAASAMFNSPYFGFLSWQQQQQQQQQQQAPAMSAPAATASAPPPHPMGQSRTPPQPSRAPAAGHRMSAAGARDAGYDGNRGALAFAGADYNFAPYEQPMASAGYGYYGQAQPTQTAGHAGVMGGVGGVSERGARPVPATHGPPDALGYPTAAYHDPQRSLPAYAPPLKQQPPQPQQMTASDALGFSVTSAPLSGSHRMPAILALGSNEAGMGYHPQNPSLSAHSEQERGFLRGGARQEPSQAPLMQQPYTAAAAGLSAANLSATENRANQPFTRPQQVHTMPLPSTGGRGGREEPGGKRPSNSGPGGGVRRGTTSGEPAAGGRGKGAGGSGRSKVRSSHDNTPQEQKYYQSDPFSMYKHNKQVLLAGTREATTTEGTGIAPSVRSSR